jgi:hypothetical protein
MPTKPATPVQVRATQGVYTTGPAPLIGTNTKISTDPNQVEGHKVDSPLGTHTVKAQIENFYNNQTDTFSKWVYEGTSGSDVNAHIVETNAQGRANIAAMKLGEATTNEFALLIIETDGSSESLMKCEGTEDKPGAIFETKNGFVPAILVRGVVDNDGGVLVDVEVVPRGPTGVRVKSLGSGGAVTHSPCYYGEQTGPVGVVFDAIAGPGSDADSGYQGGAAFR